MGAGDAAMGNGEMLQSMGRPAADPQAVEAARQAIQQQFMGLETQLQTLMQQVGQLINEYPAFGSRAQAIGEAIESIHGNLNEGMLESIKTLGEQEPAAPPSY